MSGEIVLLWIMLQVGSLLFVFVGCDGLTDLIFQVLSCFFLSLVLFFLWFLALAA